MWWSAVVQRRASKHAFACLVRSTVPVSRTVPSARHVQVQTDLNTAMMYGPHSDISWRTSYMLILYISSYVDDKIQLLTNLRSIYDANNDLFKMSLTTCNRDICYLNYNRNLNV